MKKINPYNNEINKKKQIKEMFNNIAPNYDFLNHFLSFGMDFYWRKKAVKMIKNNPKKILDIATGTADFAIIASKIKKASITGIDISNKMIEIGKKKIEKKGLEQKIKLQLADSENLPFPSNSFDAITVGFGVRNFENLNEGLSEIKRVLRPGGYLVILEPSTPELFPMKQLHKLYFKIILPFIGKLISKDKKAYEYLPKSVEAFPKKKIFIDILKKIGLKSCKHIPLTFGIVDLYIAIKN